MDFPVEDVLNRHLAMGLFAFYIAVVSLWRVMAAPEFYRLTAMKRFWGRTRGLLLHFVSNVALPLIVGIVFSSQGVAMLALSETGTGIAGCAPPSSQESALPLVPSGAEMSAPALMRPDFGPLPLPAVDIPSL